MAQDPERLAKLAASAVLQNLIAKGWAGCENAIEAAAALANFKPADKIWITPSGESWLTDYHAASSGG
jgi:hypothetical protein